MEKIIDHVLAITKAAENIDAAMQNASQPEPEKDVEICFDGLTKHGVAVIRKLVQVDIDGTMTNAADVFSRFEIETMTTKQLCQIAHTCYNSKKFCFETRDNNGNTRYPDFTIDQISI